MARTPTTLALLLGWLDEAYTGPAWHGPSLRAAIRGVDAEVAAWRPAPGRHNIWEIAVHAAFWKGAVRRRLTGHRERDFPRAGRNWFRCPEGGGRPDEGAWRRDAALVATEHRRLVRVVSGLDPASLGKPSAGHRQTPLEMVHGIAAHDVYHAGQIQLLKALSRR